MATRLVWLRVEPDGSFQSTPYDNTHTQQHPPPSPSAAVVIPQKISSACCNFTDLSSLLPMYGLLLLYFMALPEEKEYTLKVELNRDPLFQTLETV